MSNPKIDRKDAEARLQVLAREVASELGYRLKPIPKYQDYLHWRQLIGPGRELLGLSVMASGGSNYDRVHVGVQFEAEFLGRRVWDVPNRTPRPEATVSITRSAKAIADEIRRRVLPDYLPLLAQCRAAVTEYGVAAAAAQKQAQELADMIGAAVDERNPHALALNVYHSTKLPDQSFDVVVGPEEVTFSRLSVSPAVAKRILEMLTRVGR